MQENRKEKGFTTVEAIIVIFFVLPIFLFICDMFVWGIRTVTVAQTSSAIARQAGIQGGFLASAPAGYPGGDEGYISISELHDFVSKRMAWCEDDEWELKIGSSTMSKSVAHKTPEYDYTEDISVVLKTTYKWPLMSACTGQDIETTINSVRVTISEWKYNYDDWLGE